MEEITQFIPIVAAIIASVIAAGNFIAARRERSATINQRYADALARQSNSYSTLVKDLEVGYQRAMERIVVLEKQLVDAVERARIAEARISILEKQVNGE